MNAVLCLTASNAAAQQQLSKKLVPYRMGNKWGYSRIDNNWIVITPQFDDAQPFGELNGMWIKNDDIARVKKDGKSFWINGRGIRTEAEVDVKRIGESVRIAELQTADKPSDGAPIGQQSSNIRYSNGKAGLVDDGEVLLECKYDSIYAHGAFRMYAFVKLNGKWGAVATEQSKRGEWIVPAQFDAVTDMDVFGPYFLVTLDGKQGVWSNNTELLPLGYYTIRLAGGPMHYCAFAVSGKAGVRLFGLNGKPLGNEVYDWVFTNWSYIGVIPRYGIDKLVYVRKNKKYGVIDESGKAVTELKYDKLNAFPDMPYTLVMYKGKKGYIGTDGTEYFED
ncbi:WG repeat-containing protein [Chitinophaga caseinilytica]|uniref:WG repeat-containing protein n=1 Tax=Chitinophaga caseinilytica TaxID=2267521 RepID=A0ABZ2Z347_9BACT